MNRTVPGMNDSGCGGTGAAQVMFTSKPSAFASEAARFRAGVLGMSLFLASLGMLFAASLIGYLVIRVQLAYWPDDLPPLPPVLWISTLLLGVSSVTMQIALNAVRAGRQGELRRMMILTTVMAASFLVFQAVAWTGWLEDIIDRWDVSEPYRWALSSFYVLTGLHALHVFGGVIPMIVVTRRAIAGRYSSERYHGVQYCAMYWHFLGAVWIVLFIALLLGT